MTLQPADAGDTTPWRSTVEQACTHLNALAADPVTAPKIHAKPVAEVVQDKGYHANQTLTDYQEIGIRTYVSEPERGQRNWEGKSAERDAVYANRRRIKGPRGRRLLRRRGELVERSFAHCYETGAMRRTHLRGQSNILKRLLGHGAGFNLSLVLRQVMGVGTPRGLQGRAAALFATLKALINVGDSLGDRLKRFFRLRPISNDVWTLAPRA